MDEPGPDPERLRTSPRPRRTLAILCIVVLIAAMAGAVPALRWRSVQLSRVRCQTNLRRLSTALLLYAQDHDYRLPPPDYRASSERPRTWVDLLAMYIDGQRILECPANPAKGGLNREHGFRFECSYALNRRFWGHFAPGPYPLENLELPAATALLVESGLERADGPFGVKRLKCVAHTYWDTGAAPASYPSPHLRRMNVVAVDGHVETVTVAHYAPDDHSAEYGRIGRGIYNWNGGHPNGDTTGPPRE